MKCFKKVFILEGNIGAGKSTLLDLLEKQYKNITIVQEPVVLWKNINGDDLLAEFYFDPYRWGFTFELYSMLTLITTLKDSIINSKNNIIIAERSIFSNRAFQLVSENSNFYTNIEKNILTFFFNYLKKDYPAINGIIRLNTNIVTCLQRIKKRGRKEELNITYDYLNMLEDQFKTIEYKCPILDINGNYNLEKPEEILKTIAKFIEVNTQST